MSEIIAHKYVKTRKPHKCFGCAREFPKGSILKREAVAEDGTVFTAYMCPDCEDYLQSGDYSGEEIYFGQLRDIILDHPTEKGGAE